MVDLNMNYKYIDEIYKAECHGDILSGWVFLRRIVYPIAPDMPAIIYSGFIRELDQWHKNPENSESLKIKKEKESKGILRCVPKGPGDNEGYSMALHIIRNAFKIQ